MNDQIATIPAIRQPSSPHEARDWIVEDYSRMAQCYGGYAGTDTPRADIERRVVRDLIVTDAVTREEAGRIRPGPSADSLADKQAKRARSSDRRVSEIGGTIDRGQIQVQRATVPIAHATTLPTDRFSFAKGRLMRIMAGASRHPDPAVSTSTCEIPELALRAFKLYAHFALARHRPRQCDEQNPFYGLSLLDRGRLLQRMVEDICDASTGRMGPWLVPK